MQALARHFFICLILLSPPLFAMSCPDPSGSSYVWLTPKLYELLKTQPQKIEISAKDFKWCLGSSEAKPFAVLEKDWGQQKLLFAPLFFDRVESPSKDTLVIHIKNYQWFGQTLAPLCGELCDGLLHKSLAETTLPPHRALLRSFQLEEFLKFSKTDSSPEKAPVVVMGENQFDSEVIPMMSQLRKNKITPVIWAYRGPFTENHVAEPEQKNLKMISVNQVLAEETKGIKLYFAGAAKDLERWMCPALEKWKIRALDQNGQEILPPTHSRVVIMGLGMDDPKTYQLHSQLSQKGWSRIEIVSGGLIELYLNRCF